MLKSATGIVGSDLGKQIISHVSFYVHDQYDMFWCKTFMVISDLDFFCSRIEGVVFI